EVYRRLARVRHVIAGGHDPHEDSFDRTHNLSVTRLPLTLKSWGIRTLSELRGYAGAVTALRRLADVHGVTMMHCGRCLPEGLMALGVKFLTGIPYACYVWGEDITCASLSRELTWLTRRVLRQAKYIITCSRNTQ